MSSEKKYMEKRTLRLATRATIFFSLSLPVSDDVGLEKSRVEVGRFVDVFGKPGALLLEGMVDGGLIV